MGFGKKGIGNGAITSGTGNFGGASPATRNSQATRDPYASELTPEEIAAKREAFLTSERQRNGRSTKITPAVSTRDPQIIASERRAKFEPAKPTETNHTNSNGAAAIPSTKKYLFGDPQGRNIFVAYVLWYFACIFSVHRFYCGEAQSAWFQIAMIFGAFILGLIWVPIGVGMIALWLLWIFADLFLMPGMMRRFKERERTDFREVFA